MHHVIHETLNFKRAVNIPQKFRSTLFLFLCCTQFPVSCSFLYDNGRQVGVSPSLCPLSLMVFLWKVCQNTFSLSPSVILPSSSLFIWTPPKNHSLPGTPSHHMWLGTRASYALHPPLHSGLSRLLLDLPLSAHISPFYYTTLISFRVTAIHDQSQGILPLTPFCGDGLQVPLKRPSDSVSVPNMLACILPFPLH